MNNYRDFLLELVTGVVGNYVQPISFENKEEEGVCVTEVMMSGYYVEGVATVNSRYAVSSLGSVWEGGLADDLTISYREVAQLCQVYFPQFNLGQVPQVGRRGELQFLVGRKEYLGDLVEFGCTKGTQQQVLEAINFFLILNLLFLSSRAIIEGVKKKLFSANISSYCDIFTTLTEVFGDMDSIAKQVEGATSDKLKRYAQIFKQ